MRSVWQGVEANHLSQERLVVYSKEKLSWGGGGGGGVENKRSLGLRRYLI